MIFVEDRSWVQSKTALDKKLTKTLAALLSHANQSGPGNHI